LQTEFTAEQYNQINNIASIYKKKPEIVLNLTQFVNLSDAMSDYAIYRTKLSYLNSLQKTENKTPVGYSEVQQLKNNDKDFVQYLDTLIKHSGKVALQASFQDKINSLYVQDSIRIGLINKLERRNLFLKNYLMTSSEIPEKNLVIRTAETDSLKIYNQKAIYKIGMTLPGAEKSN